MTAPQKKNDDGLPSPSPFPTTHQQTKKENNSAQALHAAETARKAARRAKSAPRESRSRKLKSVEALERSSPVREEGGGLPEGQPLTYQEAMRYFHTASPPRKQVPDDSPLPTCNFLSFADLFIGPQPFVPDVHSTYEDAVDRKDDDAISPRYDFDDTIDVVVSPCQPARRRRGCGDSSSSSGSSSSSSSYVQAPRDSSLGSGEDDDGDGGGGGGERGMTSALL